MADAIFISYRRDDSEGEAGRLFDDLTRAFGSDAVFMDVAGIKPGVDFRKAIDENVTGCGVLLAVVGPRWASIADASGKLRLDDPNDFVALEIASALRRDVPVIPVLVHDATMPSVDLLPESLKAFCYRNSVELSHARWTSDVRLLIEALKSYVTPATAPSQDPIHANLPIQLPAPHPGSSPLLDKKKSKLTVAIAVGVLAAIVFAGVLVSRKRSSPPAPLQVQTSQMTPALSRPPRAIRPRPIDSSSAKPVPPQGTVKIMNVHSGLCLSPAGGVAERNAEIVQYICDGDPSRLWTVTSVGNDLYQLINVSNRLCLTIAGGVIDRNAVSVQYVCDDDPSRKWRYIELDRGMFRLVNRNSHLCLTVAGSVTDKNARAVQFPCDEDAARNWKFLPE